MAPEWPFSGRSTQLEEIRLMLRSHTGVAIFGAEGVGKTRLALQALSTLETGRIVYVSSTSSNARVPRGALGHLLPVQVPDSARFNELRWASEELLRRRCGRLLFAIDDAQWLDAASAAIIEYLVRHHDAQLLITVRANQSLSESVSALCSREGLERLDLETLTRDETEQTLTHVLGGAIEPDSLRQLWRACGGNLLYLHDIVTTGQTSRAIFFRDGCWHWTGEPTISLSLRGRIHSRIERLDAEARAVLEWVAFGEPLAEKLLRGLASSQAIERAERQGMIKTSRRDGLDEVRMVHPIIGEVARGQCPPMTTQFRRQSLAEINERLGIHSREDLLRVAAWRAESNSAHDPDMLMSAASAAWGYYEINLAACLYQSALSAGFLPAAAPLGFLLFHLGQSQQAVAMLGDVDLKSLTESDQVEHVRALAVNLSCGLGRYAETCAIIDQLLVTMRDVGCRLGVLTTSAVVDFFAGRMSRSLAKLEQISSHGSLGPRVAAEAAAIEAWNRGYRGETQRCVKTVHHALAEQDAWRGHAGYVMPTLIDAMSNAYLFSGELAEAEEWADKGLELAGRWAKWDMALVGFTTYRAQAARLRGNAHGAMQWTRDAIDRIQGWNTNVPRCQSELAHAAALLGLFDIAEAAIIEARNVSGIGMENWAIGVEANAPWLDACLGDTEGAIKALRRTASRAADLELYGYQLLATHDVVRLGSASLVVVRELDQLVERMDGEFAPLCAKHATVAYRRNADGLMEVARGFEAMGMMLYAAEAAAQASAVYRRSRNKRQAEVAAKRARQLANTFPDVMTPVLRRLATPELTARELQIALHTMRGRTDLEIANDLLLSRRTVGNHLHNAYMKLAVHSREELRRRLGWENAVLQRRST